MKKILVAATTIVALVLFVIITPVCWGTPINQARKIVDFVEKNGEQYNNDGNFKLWIICKNHDIYFIVISSAVEYPKNLEIVYYRVANSDFFKQAPAPAKMSKLAEDLVAELKSGKLEMSVRISTFSRVKKDSADKLIEYEYREFGKNKDDKTVSVKNYIFSYQLFLVDEDMTIMPAIKELDAKGAIIRHDAASPEEIDKIQKDYKNHLEKICGYLELK